MRVKFIFWGPRAPKSLQLGLLRAGVEATFKLLCKTRKHNKKPWFLALFGSLGAWLPPPWSWGALQPRSFYTPNYKTTCYGGSFGFFFWHKYCNLSCCKWASKQIGDFMKNTQNHINCEVKPNFGKKQLEVKSSPIAFYIGFSESSHTLHALYQKMCFSVESNKTLQKCNQTPFFCSNKPFKISTPEAHVLSFFSPGHKHLRKLQKHLG